MFVIVSIPPVTTAVLGEWRSLVDCHQLAYLLPDLPGMFTSESTRGRHV
jgi:hypothetical protein